MFDHVVESVVRFWISSSENIAPNYICGVASIAYKKGLGLLEYLKSARRENNLAHHDRLLSLQFE
jgi:hypothetical protein